MTQTTTIRVPAATRDRINALATRRGLAAGELVTELVEQADDRALLAEAEADWDRLAADRSALASYRAEAAALAAFDANLPEY